MRTKRLWLAVAPALTLPCLGALCYFVLFQDSTFAKLLYGSTKAFTLVWPLAATVWLLRDPLPLPTFGRNDRAALPAGALAGAGIVAAMLGLLLTPFGDVVARGVPAIRAKAQTFGILDHYWLFAALVSTLHAGLEEYYWRWFVYGRLRQLVSPWLAHALAGAAFASHHVVITSVYFGLGWGLLLGALVGVGGVIWSYLYQRQSSLAGAWVSHILVDLGIFAVGHRVLFGSYF